MVETLCTAAMTVESKLCPFLSGLMTTWTLREWSGRTYGLLLIRGTQ